MYRVIICTCLLLGLSLPPGEAFPYKKILLFPIKVVTAPVKYVKDVVYEVAAGIFLERVL